MVSVVMAGYRYFRTRFPREDGAVATEYGLLLVLIALAIVVAAGLLGDRLDLVFRDAESDLSSVP
ncbi:MAG: Flp family type IVb pilin [Chloroflexota bacterium]|nr:Flp family type IVb pilin [Chloroflexota bacterium]